MVAPEVVVITGASAGVGRATVREFAKRGAHIGLLARGREGLETARREVEAAYAKLTTPEAIIGLGSYAATMGLAAMGGKDRAKTQPWIPLALAAKAGFDATQAAKLSYDQWAKHKAFCIWCLIAAAATFATVPLVLGEAAKAVRQLGRKF